MTRGHRRALRSLLLGLLMGALLFDLIDLATGTGAFHLAGYWVLAAGLPAMVATVPRGEAPPDGLVWALAFVMLLASWLMRQPEGEVPVAAVGLSLLGTALAMLATRGGGAHAQAH